MGGVRKSHNWADDDFIDRASSPMPPVELDPWYPARYQGHPPREFPDESGIVLKTESVTATSWDIEDLREDAISGQWDNIPVGWEDWVEPEPTADPNSTLGELLYPSDNSITDISRELKIGELLAFVTPCGREQRDRCYELLRECSIGQLRWLIPWLRKRDWCGDRLQLFLEFRDHWELKSNVRWWERFHWDHLGQVWMPRYDNTTLTLEHTWELVANRVGLGVTEVIGQSWFDDWEDSAAWEHGIRSFANFSVLRASLSGGDQWQEYLDRPDRRTALEIDQCADPFFAPFMLPSIVQQYSCPWTIDARTDPWPDVTDMAHRRAAALGDNLDQAWEEIIDEITGL